MSSNCLLLEQALSRARVFSTEPHYGRPDMKLSTLALSLTAALAASPALAHPGHGASAHAHWEYVAIAVAALAAAVVWHVKKG